MHQYSAATHRSWVPQSPLELLRPSPTTLCPDRNGTTGLPPVGIITSEQCGIRCRTGVNALIPWLIHVGRGNRGGLQSRQMGSKNDGRKGGSQRARTGNDQSMGNNTATLVDIDRMSGGGGISRVGGGELRRSVTRRCHTVGGEDLCSTPC